MYAQELMGCRLRKRCASHERDCADTEGISAVAQVKALRLSPTQVRWESLWQEAGVELKSPPMIEQSIDGCVTGLNCVSALYLGEHTRAPRANIILHSHKRKKKSKRDSVPPHPLPLCPESKQQLLVTEKGWRGNGAVATGDHDADPGFHERDGEIDDLRTLLIDRQRSDGHDGFLIDHLWRAEERRAWMVGWLDGWGGD